MESGLEHPSRNYLLLLIESNVTSIGKNVNRTMNESAGQNPRLKERCSGVLTSITTITNGSTVKCRISERLIELG